MSDVADRLESIRERVEAATEGPRKDPLWFRVSALADWVEAEFPDKGPNECLGPRDVEDLRQAKRLLRSDVPYLLSLVEELREENRELRSVAARAHAYLCQDRDWEGATSILSEGPGVESLSLDIEKLDVSPANRSDVFTALRDAAQEGAE